MMKFNVTASVDGYLPNPLDPAFPPSPLSPPINLMGAGSTPDRVQANAPVDGPLDHRPILKALLAALVAALGGLLQPPPR